MGDQPFVYDGTFDQAYEILISHERGYVNHRNDRGGRTIDGIAENFHPEDFATAYKLWRSGDTEAFESFKKDFYKREYWDSNNIGAIADFGERFAAFDIAVNSGGDKSQELVRRAIEDDGVLHAGELGELQRNNYRGIIADNPSQRVFAAGWFNRADNLEEVSELSRSFWLARDQAYFDRLTGAAEVAKGEPWQLIERSEINYLDDVSVSRARLLRSQESLNLFIQPRLGEMTYEDSQERLEAIEEEVGGPVNLLSAVHRNSVTEAIDNALGNMASSIFGMDTGTLEGGLHILDVVNRRVNEMDLDDSIAARVKYTLARECGMPAEQLLIVNYDAAPDEAGGHRTGLLYFSPEDERQYFVVNNNDDLVNENDFYQENEAPWGGYNENIAVYSPNYDNVYTAYINEQENEPDTSPSTEPQFRGPAIS